MAWPLIIALFLISAWLISLGLSRDGGTYEVPFLVGSVFIGFVLPQLPALANDPLAPVFPLERMLLVSCGCALMTGIGWLVSQRPLKHSLQLVIDEQHLLYVALFESLGGAYCYYQISLMPIEVQLNYNASGIIVVYLFLGKMVTYGYAIAMLCVARRPSAFALSIVAFDLLLLGHRVLVGGRKGEAVEAMLIALVAFWFYRRWKMPRLIMLVGALVAGVSLNSTAQYRNIVRENEGSLSWQQISKINLVDNFLDVVENGGPEIRNAVERMEFVSTHYYYDFGTFHWNQIVFVFVPAQFVGADFKRSLQAYIDAPRYDAGYEPSAGSTETGMADSFGSFWYFGIIKFYLIAYVLGRLYCSARQGWVIPQILYLFGMNPAMLAVSHHTNWLPTTYIQIGILLLPGLWLLRWRRQHEQPRVTEAVPAPAG